MQNFPRAQAGLYIGQIFEEDMCRGEYVGAQLLLVFDNLIATVRASLLTRQVFLLFSMCKYCLSLVEEKVSDQTWEVLVRPICFGKSSQNPGI